MKRLLTKGGCRLLDHYLEALIRKPGATALEQARVAGFFTTAHDAWWAAACKAHGDTDGTRALIEVLLLHRHTPHQHIVAGMVAALQAGALTADAVALEVRKAAETANTDQNSRVVSGPPARYSPPRRHSGVVRLPDDLIESQAVAQNWVGAQNTASHYAILNCQQTNRPQNRARLP